jgi:hypothetical protein
LKKKSFRIITNERLIDFSFSNKKQRPQSMVLQQRAPAYNSVQQQQQASYQPSTYANSSMVHENRYVSPLVFPFFLSFRVFNLLFPLRNSNSMGASMFEPTLYANSSAVQSMRASYQAPQQSQEDSFEPTTYANVGAVRNYQEQ